MGSSQQTCNRPPDPHERHHCEGAWYRMRHSLFSILASTALHNPLWRISLSKTGNFGMFGATRPHALRDHQSFQERNEGPTR